MTDTPKAKRRILILHGTEETLNLWMKELDQRMADATDDPTVMLGVLTDDQRDVVVEAMEDHITSLSDGLKFELSEQETKELSRIGNHRGHVMNNRANCPRIREIEEQMDKLILELHELVKPTEEEIESAVDCINDIAGEEDMAFHLGDYYLTIDALDQREIEDEEETELTAAES